jgi:hypothetical protein
VQNFGEKVMTKKGQLTIRIDSEFEAILGKNRRKDETTTACFRRLAKVGDEVLTELKKHEYAARDFHEKIYSYLDSAVTHFQKNQDHLKELLEKESERRMAHKLHESVREVITKFAEDMRRPFEEINTVLASIDKQLKGKKG